ncbi:hypothetical protein D3C74_487070 [compost metagenome]
MNSAIVARSGIETGRIIRKKMTNSPAPSMWADSFSSPGISRKNEIAMSRKNVLSIDGMI